MYLKMLLFETQIGLRCWSMSYSFKICKYLMNYKIAPMLVIERTATLLDKIILLKKQK